MIPDVLVCLLALSVHRKRHVPICRRSRRCYVRRSPQRLRPFTRAYHPSLPFLTQNYETLRGSEEEEDIIYVEDMEEFDTDSEDKNVKKMNSEYH